MNSYPLPVNESDLHKEERTDVMMYRQFDELCQRELQASPADYFEFYYYDDPSVVLRCARPLHGMEIYEVFDKNTGAFCGTYPTNKVLRYLTMKTWELISGSEKTLKLPARNCDSLYE